MKFKALAGAILLAAFAVISFLYFDAKSLFRSFYILFSHPFWILAMFLFYGASFLLKAIAWRMYLQGKAKLLTCLHAIFYSLLVNHILPIKAGDIVRTGVAVYRSKDVSLDEAAHSVIIMRLLDMGVLCLFSFAGIWAFWGKAVLKYSIPSLTAGVLFVFAAIILIRKKVPQVFNKHLNLLKQGLFSVNGFFIFLLVAISWLLEASVLFSIMVLLGEGIGVWESVWVNSLTVGGQVFQVTPGGIATYEAVMSAGLSAVGMNWKLAYSAAVLSHAFKFLFSYLAGFWTVQATGLPVKKVTDWIKKKGGEYP